MVDLTEIRKKTVSATEYIKGLACAKAVYEMKEDLSVADGNCGVTEEAQRKRARYVVVAFSATWCKDCAVNIPVLLLLSKVTRKLLPTMEQELFEIIKSRQACA